MPNKHAAIKALRKTRKATIRNFRMRTHVKSLIKQLQTLVKEGKKTEAIELSRRLQQAIAKSGKNHVFHRNKADRKISAVHRSLAALK